MGENMKEVKEGQVWLTKSGEPVMFHKVGERHSAFHGYEKNRKHFGSCPNGKVVDFFDFVADNMNEEDFKEWCKTGEKPILKPATKDDEIIYQSPPIGQKHDSNKPRFSLLPSQIWQVIDVLEFGSKKYGVANWQNVDNAKERYFNACHRHLQAWWSGERLDSESGLPHLAHAVCCLLFLMWGDDELAKVHD